MDATPRAYGMANIPSVEAILLKHPHELLFCDIQEINWFAHAGLVQCVTKAGDLLGDLFLSRSKTGDVELCSKKVFHGLFVKPIFRLRRNDHVVRLNGDCGASTLAVMGLPSEFRLKT